MPNRIPSGFTLVELLLATTLIALVMTLAYSGIDASVNGIAAAHDGLEAEQRIRATQGWMRSRLARSVAVNVGDGTLLDGESPVFQGRDRYLRFAAPLNAELSWGGLYIMELRVRENDGRGVLQLRYRMAMARGASDRVTGQVWESERLLEGVGALRFNYLGPDRHGELRWTDDWRGRRSRNLPLAVRIRLQMQNGDSVEWPELTVALNHAQTRN